jgi:hypothetical protein
MGPIETYQLTNTKLNRITWLSEQDSQKEFHCLMHLFNEESLTGCFHKLDAKKAVGTDEFPIILTRLKNFSGKRKELLTNG